MPHRIQIAGLGATTAAPEMRRPDAAGAVVRLSADARQLLATSGRGDGETASVPTAADEGPSVPTEPAAIDVEFQPIRRARERVAPAQIVSAESLRSETVTPVVWLRVANLDDAPASRSRSKPAPEIPRHGVATSWFKPALMHDEAADPGDLAAAVLVSLDSARRASYGGFDHAHRAGDCAFCRRAVAAYR